MDEIINGDCLEEMKKLPDNSVDSVVTDPPYGISFMAKGWDTFNGNREYALWVEQWATECLRVLKPGGHILAFSGTRTYHALAWGVESAGFEIRDMIEWLYLSGFPKSMDVGRQFDKQAGEERKIIGTRDAGGGRNFNSWREKEGRIDLPPQHKMRSIPVTAPGTELAKQWDGWGTALKPAHEPIVMARKPLSGTVSTNVEKFGTGAIHVDACRIERQPDDRFEYGVTGNQNATTGDYGIYGHYDAVEYVPDDGGRFPANCITTVSREWYSTHFNITPRELSQKASKEDRNSDVNGNSITSEVRVTTDGRNKPIDNPFNRGETLRQNHHPTVKPTDLMAWLIRLVTPPTGIVLDPFVGSGTTLVAAKRQGFHYIGYELDVDYIEIARQRVNGVGLFSEMTV